MPNIQTIITNGNGNVLIGTTTDNGFKLNVTGTQYISGNVSIGTTYNGFALNVAGVTYVIGASVWVQNGYGYVNSGATSTGLYPKSDNTIEFRNNNATNVVIDASGNVGIGTTSPGAQLSIFDSNNSRAYQMSFGYATTETFRLGNNNATGKFTFTQLNNNNGFRFTSTAPNVTGIILDVNTSQFAINGDTGYVGINTSNPANYLQIGSMGSTGYSGNNLTIGDGTSVFAIYMASNLTNLYTNKAFSFQASGSGATGNVLIGTTTDAGYKLDVSGSFRTVGNSSVLSNYGNGSTQIYTYQISTGVSVSDNQVFDLYLGRFGNGYHKVVLWSSGYGTDSGNYFDITRTWGTSNAPRIVTNGGLRVGAATYSIHWAQVGNGQYDLFIKWYSGMPTGYSNVINYSIQSNTGAGYTQFEYPSVTVPTLDSSNKIQAIATFNYLSTYVGIGTDNPTGKLHIAQSNSGGVAAIYLSEDESTIQGPSGNTQIRMGSNLVLGGANIMTFGTSGSERMRITSDGTLQVGTTSQTYNNATYGYVASFKGAVTTQAYISVALSNQASTSEGMLFGITSTTGDIYVLDNKPLVFYTNGTEKMRITTSGNVGINTTSPSDFLHIRTGTGWGARITYTGDNSYLRFSSNQIAAFNSSNNGTDLYFNHNAAGNILFSGTGNVGIGTTSPSHKLTVSRTTEAAAYQININNDGGISDGNFTGIRFSQDSSGATELGNIRLHYYSTGATDLSFGNRYQTQALTIKNGGNVLIGTTTDAGNKLDVVTGADGSVLRLLAAAGNQTYFGFDSSGGYIETNGASTGRQRLRLQSYNGSAYTQLFIDGGNQYIYTSSNVNVGIGTTSPGGRLDVVGTATLSGTAGYTLRATQDQTTYRGVVLGYDTSGQIGIIYPETAGPASTLAIWTYSGSAWGERMRITSSGNVGIGTTAPDTPLSSARGIVINSGASNDVQIRMQNNGTGSAGSDGGLLSISGSQMYLWNYEASNLIFGTNNSERMRIDSSGNIGIGTTSISYRVDISGDARILSGSLGVGVAPNATDGRIDASNDIVAYSTSDQRLKENVTPIENALEKVKTLTGVEFDWKEETAHVHGYHGHDIGIIAQDVQAVLPEAVRTNDSGYLSVRYEKMIALLIEANKELAARVEELEKKLK